MTDTSTPHDRAPACRIVRGGEGYEADGVPHLRINRSDEPVVAVIARTDPNEQESVVLMPELDDVPDRGAS